MHQYLPAFTFGIIKLTSRKIFGAPLLSPTKHCSTSLKSMHQKKYYLLNESKVPVLQEHFPGQLFLLGKSGERVDMEVFLEFSWADPANLQRSRPSRTNEIHSTTGLCIYRY
jgi:hypothetical protein